MKKSNLKSKTFLLFPFLLLSCIQLFAQQNNPTIAVCNGKQYVCAIGQSHTVCGEIIVDPKFGIIDSFTINWGDGSPILKVPGNGTLAPPPQTHTYNLSGFYKTCLRQKDFTMKLLSYKPGVSIPANNGQDISFYNSPTANFDFSVPKGCVNKPLMMIDKSCLRDSMNSPVMWTYGDGTTGTSITHTYLKPGFYDVKMKVSNDCGSDEKIKTIEIVDLPKAIITADSGLIKPKRSVKQNDTVKVCLKYINGIINFNGEKSLNASSYKWEIAPASGWVLNQPNTINNSKDLFSIDFDQKGIYRLKLTVDNMACFKPDTLGFFVKVVDTVNLRLDHQLDVCDNLKYKPIPFFKDAKYYIDGKLISSFPVTLSPRIPKYKIEAFLNNECNNSSAKDSFYVIGKSGISFITPKVNAILCLNSGKIKLDATPGGGKWTGSNVTASGSDYYFDPINLGKFTLNYVVGSGTCEQKSNINIEVIKDLVVSLPRQDDVCNTLSYTPQKLDSKFTYKIDGMSVSVFPKTLAVRNTPYIVTAEYKGMCAAQLVSDTFFVKDKPSAKFLFPKADTVVCESNTPIKLKSEITGGLYSGSSFLSGNIFTPSAAGIYNIKYNIGTGTCENTEAIKITVVKDLVVMLPSQDDVCNQLSYQPQNYDSKIIYTIDGKVISSFPQSLAVRSAPYYVTAKYTGVCGNQFKADTFYVRAIPSAKILSPSKDTVLCLMSTPITLKTKDQGGTFSGSTFINGDIFTPKEVGSFPITYTIGTGTCEQKSTINIKVEKDLVVSMPAQSDECIPISFTPKAFNSLIKYKINGVETKVFPVPLAISLTPYIITAEYTGVCGYQKVSDTFKLSAIPSAKILSPSKDTVLCLMSTPITLKTKDLGGTFSGSTSINGSVFTPKELGSFPITYTIGTGTCEQKSIVNITVEKDLVVSLPVQSDECIPISFTPKAFNSLIKYKINGVETKVFPVPLAISVTPYIITAEYTGVCGYQKVSDTFKLSAIPSAKILFPANDTVLCLNSRSITLKTKDQGGVFSGSTLINGSIFSPSEIGSFPITYTIGKGTCEQKDTAKIKVEKDLVVTLPRESDECISRSYTPKDYNPLIKYKINGVETKAFPVPLAISPIPYIITAEYTGVCGYQIEKDTFYLSEIPSAKILSPPNDTTLCLKSTPIILKPKDKGGIFSGSSFLNGNIFTPDAEGEYLIIYTIGKNTCEQNDTVKIKVEKDLIVKLPNQEDVCNTFEYQPGDYNSKITYRINDTIVSKFPVNLPISSNRFRIQAYYKGVCGEQSLRDSFFVRTPQSAKILFPTKDTVICEGSTPIPLKSEVFGGIFSGTTAMVGNIFNPDMRGDYLIRYTIGTKTCENKDSVRIKVEKDLVVSLPPQADVCNPLDYTPEAYDNRISYRINDTIVKVFPIKLPVGTKPYVVKASFSGVCGDQEKIDSFWVREPEKLQFLSPLKDTSICLSTTPLKITANVLGGTWTGKDIAQDGAFLPSSASDYTLSYSIGSGTCKVDKSLKINVQKATASVKSMVLCTYTPITQIVASPVGGRFYSIDCPTCIDSTGLFNVKNLGDSTKALVYYNYKNPLGCSGVFSADIEVENPIADFKVSKACEGEPVSIEFNNTKAKSVEWYLDGNPVDLKSINNLSYGPHKIKLVAKSTYCVNALEKTLNVVNKPRLTRFDFLLSSVCSPADVTFNPKPSLQPNMNYFWDFGRTSNDTLSIFQPPVIKYDTKTYTISTLKVGLRTYNECGSLFFDTSFQLKSLPLPRVQLDSSKVGCSPYEVTLTNRSLGEIDSCYWDFGNGKYYKRCDNFVRTTYVTPDSTKIFKPVLYTYNICGVKSDTAQIKVTPPGIRAFFNTDKYLICPFDTIPFVDASTPKPEKLAWFFGDGGVSQISNPYHVFTKSDSIFKITLRAYGKCGYDTISHTIKTKVAPPINFEIPNYGCQDKAIIVKNLSPANLWKYRWTTSDGAVYENKYDLEHIFKSGNRTEKVTLKVTNFEGCTNELAREIPIREKPIADFDVVNPKGCTPQRIHFINKSKNADSYIWYFGDSSTTKIENPYHAYISNGSYDVKLIALYDNNCIDSTIKINFVYIYDCNCYVPNIFTPNGDGVNDIFTVYGNDAIDKIENMEIYDRWGDKVYEGAEINAIGNGWDGYLRGVLAVEGVYTYLLKVRYKDGSTKVVKGDVTLMY
ncbi:MAG: PKD domain-containing protein [Saprospiraceae bacterium]